MIIILLAGLALIGLAAALGARALTFGRLESAQQLRAIAMYGFGASAEPGGERVPLVDLRRLAEVVGARVTKGMSEADRAKTRRELLSAGLYMATIEVFYGYRVLATAALSGFLLLLAVGAPSVATVLGAPVAALLGWRIPMVVVERRARSRREQIDRDLPELIDLLVVSVEAGLGLAGSLQQLSRRIEGPLGAELRLVQQEQSMGLSGDQALNNLLDRCDTLSVRSFVRSLQQGERLGVSIGQILRNLAREMRTRRRQLAEERAQKAPIKMLFPLVFLIFPSIFIVLLGPAYFAFDLAFG